MDFPLPETMLAPLEHALLADLTGSVVQTIGQTIAVAGFPAPVGAMVEVSLGSGPSIEAEVVGFQDQTTLVMPLDQLEGVRRGNQVRLVRTARSMRVGPGLLGRVVDAQGQTVDGRPQPMLWQRRLLRSDPEPPTMRPRIDQPLATGLKTIDGLLTCGQGQRLGIFAGSGVGKSVLLGIMGRYTNADVTVIALVGERGREVNEFINRQLGPEGMRRSVVVVATGDQPAQLRVQAAYTATTIAEYFRDQGNNVLMIMDSITRFALAQREIGLAAGEPPTTRGFPPSVFARLPKLVERAGRTQAGTITAFYSVLVEGDDENEPVADTMRGLLDGHVWLSRSLAERGHYPAIDLLRSISRLAGEVTSHEHQNNVQTMRRLLATYEKHEDLLSIGAYRQGSNRELDVAVEMRDTFDQFLQQGKDESTTLEQVQQEVARIAGLCQGKLAASQVAATTT
jgi:flagellum-specific ATP synthase